MRLIDADALYDKAEAWYKNAPTPYRKIYRSFVDIIADATTISPTSNVTLTLEQLREMDGEPVWLEITGCDGHYVMLLGYDCTKNGFCFYGEITRKVEDYGKIWLAYRRKPEGG